MIKTEDAITYARSLIGTPYGSGKGQLDCINLIKAIIRHCPGGLATYTDAGTAALWQSYHSSGKYMHLTKQIMSVTDAVPGMLAFKGLPLGKDGQPHHVGLVSGKTTVIHASSALGQVVETDLKNGQWDLLGVSKYIEVSAEEDKGVPEAEYWQAVVKVDSGRLNLRTGPGTEYPVIAKLDNGTKVTGIIEYAGWATVKSDAGTGYVAAQYLERIASDPEPEQSAAVGPEPEASQMPACTTLTDGEKFFMLVGTWRVVDD